MKRPHKDTHPTVSGPAPKHALPVDGYVSGNCARGLCRNCFTLKCTHPCHGGKK